MNLLNYRAPQNPLLGGPRPQEDPRYVNRIIGAIQPARQEPSFLERVLGMYGADPTSHIPEHQKGLAAKLGLQMGVARNQQMQQSMPGGQSFVQGLTGLMQGLQSGGAAVGAMNAKALRDMKIRDAINSGNLDVNTLKGMMAEALMMGDNESARTLAEVIKSMAGQGAMRPIATDKPVFDPNTGEWILPPGFDPDTLGEPDSWQDLGNVKVPIYGGQPYYPGALPKGMSPGQQESGLRWTIGRYEQNLKAVEPSFRLTNMSLRNVEAAKAGDGAAQLALLYGFIRALDPNSVVREGEVRLADEAQSLRGRMITRYNYLVDDISKVMNPQQVEQVAAIMKQLEEENARWLQAQQGTATTLGGRYASNISEYIRDPLAGLSGAWAPAGLGQPIDASSGNPVYQRPGEPGFDAIGAPPQNIFDQDFD